ncbi:hypothetical protein TNCV_3858581 [Trichonephila clavipes]|nr:hypothetical protein TNCV_3858581 [Trichonephila clavipes]
MSLYGFNVHLSLSMYMAGLLWHHDSKAAFTPRQSASRVERLANQRLHPARDEVTLMEIDSTSSCAMCFNGINGFQGEGTSVEDDERAGHPSRRAASPLVRLVKGQEEWEAPDHPQVSSLKIGVEMSQIVLLPVWCSKLRLTTDVTYPLP